MTKHEHPKISNCLLLYKALQMGIPPRVRPAPLKMPPVPPVGRHSPRLEGFKLYWPAVLIVGAVFTLCTFLAFVSSR